MRRRSIHPDFFSDEDLLEMPPLTRILFAGLWCIADRDGKLEDRPARIKIKLLPMDAHDVDAALNDLARAEMLSRYEVDGKRYIQVHGFGRYQHPHPSEAPSRIPWPAGHVAAERGEGGRAVPDDVPGGTSTRTEREEKVIRPVPEGDPDGVPQAVSTSTEVIRAVPEGDPGGTPMGTGRNEKVIRAGYVPSDPHAFMPSDPHALGVGAPQAPARPRAAPRLVDTSHRSHAFCGRVCVPSSLHQELVRKWGGQTDGADEALRAWYRTVDDDWSLGARASQPIGDDNFAFWRARFVERSGTTRATPATASVLEDARAVGERVMHKLLAKQQAAVGGAS